MIKLIACDMDGTLLNDQKEIDPDIYNVLPKLKGKQIRFCAASGRQFRSLETLFKKHIEDVVIIAENGAYVVHNGTELYASVMQKEFVNYCVDVISALPNVTPLVCGKMHCYTTSKEVYEEMTTPKFYYDIKLVDNLKTISEDVIKVSLIDYTENGAAGHSFIELEPLIKGKGEIAVSGFACLDIVNKGVSKGAAIAKLQNKWGIDVGETMAFGDNFNDVEMLAQAGYSFAMQEAHPDVKKHAKFVAGSNNDGSVVKEIRKLTKTFC